MAEIKTIYKGESISLLFTFQVAYDMARLTSQKVFIGETEFAGVIDGQTVKMQLKSSDTDRMIGTHRVVLWMVDTTLGLRKPYCGDLVVAKTQAAGNTVSVSDISDIIIPIVISETAVTVGDILYNYVIGRSAYQVWLEAGNIGTEADFFAYLQQPAADMIASLNETNEAALTAEGLRTGAEITRGQNEQARITAEGLRVNAESARQTNTATAITNANNAATLANTKAGLADTAAINANAIANSKPTIFEGYANLPAGVETLISGTSFTPVLNLRPVNIQVFYDGMLKNVAARYVVNGDNYDIYLTSTVDLFGAEITLLGSLLNPFKSIKFGYEEYTAANYTAVKTIKGDLIENVTDNAEWAKRATRYTNAYAAAIADGDNAITAARKANLAAAAWCHFNNDPENDKIYGKIYNGYALIAFDDALLSVNHKFRAITLDKLTSLMDYCGGATVGGGKLKEAGLTHWLTPNTGADNSSGIGLLGSGFRSAAGAFFDFNKTSGILCRNGNGISSVVAKHNSASFFLTSNDSKIQGLPIRFQTKAIPTLPFDNGKLMLTFDDASTTWDTVLYPLLQNKGVKGTFFVWGSQAGTAGFVTWKKLLEMHNSGHDIQCHTWTHPNLSVLSEAQIITELTNVNNAFAAAGLPLPLDIAYPTGTSNESAKRYIRNSGLRLTGRSILGGFTITRLFGSNVDPFDIPSKVFTGTIADLPSYVSLMDQAKSQKLCLSLYGHYVVTTNREVINHNYVTAELVGAIIDYAVSIGIDIITTKQLRDII